MPFQGSPNLSAKDRRDLRQQRPSFAPGQGDSKIWGSASMPGIPRPGGPTPGGPSPFQRPGGPPAGPGAFARPGMSGPSPFQRPGPGLLGSPPSAGPRPTPFGAPGGGGFGSPFQQQQQQPGPKDAISQAAQEAAVKASTAAAKGTWEFAKASSEAVKQHNSFSLARLSVNGMKGSVGAGVFGLLLWVFSIFIPLLGFGFYIMMGSLLSLCGYLVSFAAFYSISQKAGVTEPKPKMPRPSSPSLPTAPPNPMAPPPPISLPKVDEPEDEEDEWDDYSFDDDDDEDEEEEVPPAVPVSELMEQSLDITPGTQTRSYLYERFHQALININPSFGKFKTWSDSSDKWADLEEKLQETAEVHGTKEENLPDLEEVHENDFVLKMIIRRTPNLKVKAIADEMAEVYSRDDTGKVIREGCFAVSSEFGSKASITIYKGAQSILISLKDMYGSVEDFVKNPDHLMPVVLGTSSEGDVQVVDYKSATGCVISGPPRKGKSWVTKLIFNQIAMFNSPSDVNFYIGDPKDGISDFVDYNLPHVVRKEFTPQGVIRMLRWVTHDERLRRMQIFREKGCKEIFEFRKRNPDVPMPFMFIILDEMATLVTSMDKEEAREYRDLLLQLVSQLPAYGIRGIFIAHRVKNDIIPKNVSELIPYRITVGAIGEEVRDNLSLTNLGEFPYQLASPGDMGIRIADLSGGHPIYSHAAVISKDNTSLSEFERYIEKIWNHLDPNPARDAAPFPDQPGVSTIEVPNSFAKPTPIPKAPQPDPLPSLPTVPTPPTTRSAPPLPLQEERQEILGDDSFWEGL